MGKTRDQVVLMFFFSSFISIPARFIISYFVDNTQLRLKWVLMALSFTIATYTTGINVFQYNFWLVDDHYQLWAFRRNLGGSLQCGFSPLFWPETFRRHQRTEHVHHGHRQLPWDRSFSAPFGNWGSGSYRQASLLALTLPIVVFVLSFFTRNPQRKYAEQDIPGTIVAFFN